MDPDPRSSGPSGERSEPTPTSDTTRSVPRPRASAPGEDHETNATSRVGHYVVHEPIGRGGMGTVYAAYDGRLDRRVAIKMLHTDRLSRDDDEERLWREAKAMAKLSHPNVVTVHEVGRSDDTVYIAMELVPGLSLDAWLRSEPPWPAVLDAYVQAGRGLAAAHDAGLVHRDFKPHNVMRTEDGEIKVLDFGLARATNARSLESSRGPMLESQESLTRSGAVMGTPRYMSPEQHDGLEVDERSDQYAFCVAMWEGLARQRPFATRDREELEAAKRRGPPAWPTKTASSEAASVPRFVTDALRRGLCVDPSERWPSMSALLAALQRDPRRRRVRWALGLAAVSVVAAGATMLHAGTQEQDRRCTGAAAELQGIWDETRRAEVQAAIVGIGRAYAAAVWDRTDRALSDYADEWAATHTEACEATTVRAERSHQMLDLQMACLHRALLSLQAAVDTLAEVDPDVVDRAHEVVASLRPLERCADADALSSELELPLPHEADAVEQARRLLSRATSEQRAGRYRSAKAALEDARHALEGAAYEPIWIELTLAEGELYERLGDFEASEAVLEDALERASKTKDLPSLARASSRLMYVVGVRQRRMEEGLQYWPLASTSSVGRPRLESYARQTHGHVLFDMGKLDESEAEYRAAVALLEELEGLELASARNGLSMVLYAQGEYDESETQLRAALERRTQVLGPEHPDVADARNNLGIVLDARGLYEAAEAEYRAALELRMAALGPEHPDVASSRINLGGILQIQGRYDAAETEYRAAIESLTSSVGPDHLNVAAARDSLGIVLMQQGMNDESEVEHRAALALRQELLEPDHPDVATSRSNLANVLHARGMHAEALVEYRAALASWTKTLGPDNPMTTVSQHNIGIVLNARGEHEEAQTMLRAALKTRESALEPDHPDLARSRIHLAVSLLARERFDDALPIAEQAWERLDRDDVPPGERAHAGFVLARILWNEGGDARERALALTRDAVQRYRTAGPVFAGELRDAQRWLNARG